MYSVEATKENMLYKDSVENIDISLPKDNFLDLIQISEPSELIWPRDYIKSLQTPIGTNNLSKLSKGVKKIVIIASDATRAVPTSKVLPLILDELFESGIKIEQITVVIALGVHRPATEDEMIKIIGEDYWGKLKIINHNAFDKNQLVYIGETSYGTPVEVNKIVYEADLRITIGKVEPHEFAGFSGGRKSVLPGISSERTIEINHRPEMLLKSGSSPGIMDHNPINEDMMESAKMLGIDFIVNFVVNREGNPIGIFCGDIVKAHYKAIDFMRSFCQIKLQEPPDIIVTTPGYPLNIDFYQSIKSLIAVSTIMDEGGIIILYTKCSEGVCSDDLLIPYEGTSTLEEVIENLLGKYRIQMDHALLLSKILLKKIKIITCSPNIDSEIFTQMYLEPAHSPQEALDKAMKEINKENPKVLFFPQPQRTLPVLR